MPRPDGVSGDPTGIPKPDLTAVPARGGTGFGMTTVRSGAMSWSTAHMYYVRFGGGMFQANFSKNLGMETVGTPAGESNQACVSKQLQLLTNFIADVAVGGMKVGKPWLQRIHFVQIE